KQIAEMAGVNEATLFRKYGSKIELVVKAIKSSMEQSDVKSTIYYTGDVREDLSRILTRFFEVESQRTEGHIFMLLASEMKRHPELQQIVSIPLGVIAEVGKLIARYQSEGILKMENPIQATATLIGPIALIQRLGSFSSDFEMPEIDLPAVIDNYLTGRLVKT
ncbi:MAG: TetR/AcrR family transcriptional regulator, partial [Chloroflexota bacterium]